MSEEILKALTQLFAIITKQDGGVTENERQYVLRFFQQELDQDSVANYLTMYDDLVGYGKVEEAEKDANGEEIAVKKPRRTSMKDSVRTLGICKKINKTLTQKQKVVVLMKLMELVASDSNLSPQRMEIINTVSDVFKIANDEYRACEAFILLEDEIALQQENIISLSKEDPLLDNNNIHVDIKGHMHFLRIPSVEMYFVKYVGTEDIILNGFILKIRGVYLFSNGSTIKTPKGMALYYSDLIRNFFHEDNLTALSFNADQIEFKFPSGDVGLRNINISEGPGKLIGIMGASGAGKTTLLNVLAGLNAPSSGTIKINGLDMNSPEGKENLKGVIGYIAQDDLLIEELTVYENLYYNAKLCFDDMSEEDLHQRVMDVLTNLGLETRKDLKVGSVLDKTISGGQRKRLNIALELIREPAVLFVDEPTSGLSSRDSENVIDLLKELSLRGKLIFVVIHQPSSDIYKMFDKMIILDTGGYQIFYGHPVEAVNYFKRETNQVDAERGQCPSCGNVNPEQIFNIVESCVVDEYGEFTKKRKVTPTQWKDRYEDNFEHQRIEDVSVVPEKSLKIPNYFKQAKIFITRDVLSKISNKQYLFINLLEAPILALVLAFIIRYKSAPDLSGYIYRFNENIPIFIMMAVIVSLFMGLTVSAEEIIRDKKIRKRESFLNLSWNSYLMSKIGILFSLSAIQALGFVLVSNTILEIRGMYFEYWLVMFSVACFANILGLNVSSAFNSAVTVYILIPLVIIPQMVLSGLLFPFEKMNEVISTKGKVPVIADVMVSRWSYEALAVKQFRDNAYEATYYPMEQQERQADFKASYFIKELRAEVQYIKNNLGKEDPKLQQQISENLRTIKNSIEAEAFKGVLKDYDLAVLLQEDKVNESTFTVLNEYLSQLEQEYLKVYNEAVSKKNFYIHALEHAENSTYNLNDYKNKYSNESLTDLVRNLTVQDRILQYNGRLLQQLDPIFHLPETPAHALDYRTHFFAPKKHLFGQYFDTYYFNILVIWFMSALLYLALYKEWLAKLMEKASSGNLFKRKG
ncbi:ATP-binding cassette domain-containing protein [Persicobacter psychrovividus]|uniref:ABC transporter domain-containing protein n=1 Tax=Persicobacter psychrovividus TaxID=387638 RepID=A0ABM7VF95_9BACT|nr:hypothetical protein PEPS_19050 [Persicobacter psychrovividus]